MVGDGINDSAVLAQADLGIAMGQGSDIAIDVEKVTILSSDLTKIAAAVRLSAATVRTVRQNLFWAFIYNLIGVPVAAGVLYPLTRFLLNSMLVGAAMALSSVSVVANSLQLSTKRLGTKAVHKINTEFITKKQTAMKKEYRIEGIMCNHCRMHVEKALNGIEVSVPLLLSILLPRRSNSLGGSRSWPNCSGCWAKIIRSRSVETPVSERPLSIYKGIAAPENP